MSLRHHENMKWKNQRVHIYEQIIRPTGLLDPEIEVRPARHQVDDLYAELKKVVSRKSRALITTLTKKMAEDLTTYFNELDFRINYIHADINSLERVEILRDLRKGEIDILVGINLLREGIDLPEVDFVAIMDADKEGFLRSRTALIQIVGRAARNEKRSCYFLCRSYDCLYASLYRRNQSATSHSN